MVENLLVAGRLGLHRDTGQGYDGQVDPSDASLILVASMCQTAGANSLKAASTIIDMQPKDHIFEGNQRFGDALSNIIASKTGAAVRIVTIFPVLGQAAIVCERKVGEGKKTEGYTYLSPDYSEETRFRNVRVCYELYPELLKNIGSFITG